jgi:phosphotransferase system enzyme I (PtsP)
MLDILRSIVQEVGEAGDLDEALHIIVSRVRDALGLDVCSVYLQDPARGEYVLRATEGLSPASVGQVRLAPGEGLVGLTAARKEPVHVQDPATHPGYRYFPEIGEERLGSFLGVPIIHYRQVLGVLVAQQRDNRLFGADESAFLITIAAQLAGAIHQVSVIGSVANLLEGGGDAPNFIQGVQAGRGIGIGTAVITSATADLGTVPDRSADDPEEEIVRLRGAIARVQADMRARGERLAPLVSAAERALFDVYAMLLDSDTLVDDMIAHIRAGSWAPTAVRDTIAEHTRLFDAVDDPYIAARGEDIREIGRRILLHLYQESSPEPPDYPAHCVLVGDEVGIGDIADVPRDRLAGIVTSRGAAFSHTAVLARAMGIPAVVDVGELPLAQLAGHAVIVDGHQGRVFVEPPQPVLDEYRRLAREEEKLSAELRALRDLPAETPDGVRLTLHVNTGLLSDISPSLECGADGVGLYRTEVPFMVREAFPGEEVQLQVYQKVLSAFAPRPVTMRTLDVGGDKPLPYFSVSEANPFLGWRGIRVTLDHPEIFLTQLRAMLRANAGLGNLRIMFPMVSQIAELDDALALLDRAIAELAEIGIEVARPEVGAMIEVPAAVYEARRLAERVDFLSIGTNDLTQYILAVDRTNSRVARLYDNLHPAVLRAVADTLAAGRAEGAPVSVCGDMAGDPAGALVLIGLGFEVLSMTAASIGRAKRLIRTVSFATATEVARAALACADARAARRVVTDAIDAAGLGNLLGGR